MTTDSNSPTEPPDPVEEGVRRLHAGPDTALLEELRAENERLRELLKEGEL